MMFFSVQTACLFRATNGTFSCCKRSARFHCKQRFSSLQTPLFWCRLAAGANAVFSLVLTAFFVVGCKWCLVALKTPLRGLPVALLGCGIAVASFACRGVGLAWCRRAPFGGQGAGCWRKTPYKALWRVFSLSACNYASAVPFCVCGALYEPWRGLSLPKAF